LKYEPWNYCFTWFSRSRICRCNQVKSIV